MLRKTTCTACSYQLQLQENLQPEIQEGNGAKDNLLKGKIQAARPRNTNRMQSDINVVPVKSEISLRETTIDGCAQRRRERRMELQREKPLRFLQTTVRNRPLPLGDAGRRGKSAGDGRGCRRAPGFGALSNPGELGCDAARE